MPDRHLLAPLLWLMLLPATAAAQHDSATIRDTALASQLIEHGKADQGIRDYALPLLRRAAARHQAPGEWVALLTDRLAVARGQPQEYGTQGKIENDRVTFRPIADSAHVDQRRARLGMMPLTEYRRMLDSMYTSQGRPAPDSSR